MDSDESFVIRADFELDRIPAPKIVNSHRCVHGISTEKELFLRTNLNKSKAVSDRFNKTMKPTLTVGT